MQPSDEYLIQKAQEGVQSAFEDIYNRHKRHIFNYIYRLLGNRSVAEELTQETFVRAYVNVSAYKPTGKVSSWLYAIAGNAAKNELRSRKYRKAIPLEAPISADEKITLGNILRDNSLKPDDILENKELKQQIQKVINELSVDHREVLVLCDVQGFSYEDAAEIIGCGAGTVASRLSRARAAFVKIFNANFGTRT